MQSVIWLLILTACLLAGPVEDLQPNCWYEVPNSRVESVKPNPEPPSWSGFTGLYAWCGGAFDTKRDRLMVWGGGHADYTGNEIYAFSMNTLSWARSWGPTANIPSSGTSETYHDGNPSARHTYDNLVYNRATDAFFSSGGSLSWGGNQTSGTWEFRLSSSTWTRRQNLLYGSIYSQSSYDPATDLIYKCDEAGLNEYNSTTNTWTKRSSQGNGWDWEPCGEIDSLRRVMVLLGGGGFHVFNLRNFSYSSSTPTGNTEILNAYAPGLTWDGKSQKLVAWNGGSSVYTITISADLTSYSIQKISPAAGNTVTPPAAYSYGTYSKFQYCPSKNVFVLTNQVNQNVFIYRLTAGAGTAREINAGPATTAFSVFPNPCPGKTEITLPQPGAISIYSVSGRMVEAFPGKIKTAVWNAEKHAAGVYIVRAEINGSKFERKIIKNR